MEIKVPFLKEDLGLGDAVKSIVSAVGVEPKKDCGCAKRRALLNKALMLKPKDQ